MNKTLISIWPLFLGLGLIMAGSGLQGTLLSVRADMEGFSTITIGIVMSLLSAGHMAGCLLVPRMIENVGHIRVFTALASLASVTTLLQGIFVYPLVWALMRALTGFCFAGVYITVESWMNDVATNAIRGKLLGFYLLVYYSGLVAGQLIFPLSNPELIVPFIIVSCLISLSLVPISLSKRPAPDFSAPDPIGLKKLIKASRLGCAGVLLTGFGISAVIAIAPLYAIQSAMSLREIAHLMTAFMLGGVAFQVPIGYISDRMPRRTVIIITSLMAGLFFILCYMFRDQQLLLYLFFFLAGGVSLCIYALCAAYTNDFLRQNQIVSASASLILLSGLGALIGPLAVTTIMSFCGKDSFFLILAAAFATIGLYGMKRAVTSTPMPVEDQGEYAYIPPRASTYVGNIVSEDATAEE